jgi:LacI family transcriptional regulator
MPAYTGIPRVLLWIESSNSYGRRILEGIGRRVRESGPWSLYLKLRGQEEHLPPWVTRWQGEGILARTTSRAMTQRLRGLGVPMVELLGHDREEPARVHGENASAGRLAAEHLLECGLRNFGFFTYGAPWWIERYREGFVETLKMFRSTCNVYRPPRPDRGLVPQWHAGMQPSATRWLRGLAKPAGIFAPSYDFAATLMNTCRSEGIAVPDEVAVIGSVDDPAICNVFTPPLSCVDIPAERIGYEAAGMLQRMMAGEPPPAETLWIPATHVVQRQSTDLVAVEDADVARALRFIRQRACQGICVPDVALEVGISRRVLERKFREFVKRTPKDEILRTQLEHAKLLLAQSDMSIEAVAEHSGFPSFKHLAGLFRREVGATPKAYRKVQRVVRYEDAERYGGK